MFGVSDGLEPVAVFDEVVFFEPLQRGTDASLGHVDGVDDLPLTKCLVGVLEEETIDRTLGGIRRKVGKRGVVLVDRPEVLFRDGHLEYCLV